MLAILMGHWAQPPYRLPFEVCLEIIKFLSFEQAEQLGASDLHLDYIAKTSPPLGLSNMLNNELLELAASNTIIPTCLRSTLKPWFITSRQKFKYYLRRYFDQLRASLDYEVYFVVKTTRVTLHFYSLSIGFLALHGMLDLLRLSFESMPELFLKPENNVVYLAALNILEFASAIPDIPYPPSALRHAAREGHLQIVQFMIENEMDYDSESVLDAAANSGNLQLVKYIHDNLDESNICTCLGMMMATIRGHLEVVKFLTENRSEDLSIPQAYIAAKREGHLCIAEYLEARLSK